MEKAYLGKAVRHRDHLYPPRFGVVWAREDGLEVTIDIRVDPVEGPIPMSATISGPEGIRADYRQPIPAMTRQAAAQVSLLAKPDGSASPVPPGRSVPMGRRPGRPTAKQKADRLRRVAKAYNAAVEAGPGHSVAEAVMKVEPMTRSTAFGLIYEVRKAGLISATTPGRKQA